MKRTVSSALAAAAVLVFTSAADAQTTLATQNVTATVTVGTQARLTVTAAVAFPDSDPDTVDPIPATGPVNVTARARVAPATQLNVTVNAADAFFDMGTNSIPITGLLWTVGGAPWQPGTMATTPVLLAQWNGPANQSTAQNYTLDNAWTYVPGVHDVVLVYTLSTP